MRLASFLTFCAAAVSIASPAAALPHFAHIIIIVQENRTPDNLFGGDLNALPSGADVQASAPASGGQTISFTPVDLAGCYDISHSHGSWELAYTQGFDKSPVCKDKNPQCSKNCNAGTNPQYRYVTPSEVAPYFAIAANYGFANRMFQTNQGPSYPSHQFLFGGTSAPAADTDLFVAENPDTTSPYPDYGCAASPSATVTTIDGGGNEHKKAVFPCYDRPTLGNLLDTNGISWKYYGAAYQSTATALLQYYWLAPNSIPSVCVPQGSGIARQCTGTEWNAHVVPANPAQILTDIKGCALAAVSWVTPTAANSDHAGADGATGPDWVASIINAIGGGSLSCAQENYWSDTAIFVTWDDWGGWADHVTGTVKEPPVVPLNSGQWGAGYAYGFRVPLLVVSAYTGTNTSTGVTGVTDGKTNPLDFGSLLYFIEQNFGLGFIGPGSTKDNYGNYADYWSHNGQFITGTLDPFFALTTPRSFTAIPTSVPASYFLNAPPDPRPVDNDE